MLPRMSMQKECAPKEESLPETHLDASLEVPLANPARQKKKYDPRGGVDDTMVTSPNREWTCTTTEKTGTPWWFGTCGSQSYAVFMERAEYRFKVGTLKMRFCRIDPTSMKIQETYASKDTKLEDAPFKFVVVDVPKKGIVCFYLSRDGTSVEWCGKNASRFSRPQSERDKPWTHIAASREKVLVADSTNTIHVYDIEEDEKGNLSLRKTNKVSIYEPGSKLDMTREALNIMTMDDTNRVILHYEQKFFIFTALSDAYMVPHIVTAYKGLTYQDMVISGNRLYALRYSNNLAEYERKDYPFVVDVYKLTRNTIEHVYAHKSLMDGYPRSFCASSKRSLIIETNAYTHMFQIPS
jgi:hypothetical protein